MITLRPINFAYEDREQILLLITETLKRLSTAANSDDCSPKLFWEKIDAVMTDAASMNLKIEQEVAKKLKSDHIPHHLLCKSHTCEIMDTDNLTTLATIENKIKLRELILKREPLLKSFLGQSKSIVETALIAILKLVSHGGDGKSTSLAEQFDLILEESGVYKSFSLYNVGLGLNKLLESSRD